jgi:hypothetical protein
MPPFHPQPFARDTGLKQYWSRSDEMTTISRSLKLALACCAALLPVAGSAAPAGDAFATAARLHRGVNVLGYDPVWKDSARARFQPRHFATICKGGFDFIRLVLQAFDHRAAPKSVLFELLNEPHGKLDADRWNALLAQILPVVRASNPQRTLVIGPTNWNSLSKLDSLKLPASDRNILVTFHYYEPFRFTHQGAPWTDNRDLHGIPLTLVRTSTRSRPGARPTNARYCSANLGPSTRAVRRWRTACATLPSSGAMPKPMPSPGPIGNSTAISSSTTLITTLGSSRSAKL